MDDTKTGWFRYLMLGIFLLAPAMSSADIEFVSQKQRDSLIDTFTKAHSPTQLQGRWKCELYGVRSSMQVHHDIELYRWLASDQPGLYKNLGAQPVNNYTLEAGILKGQQDRFEDQVKRTDDGHLISQLSVLTPQRMIVAYALCSSSP
jgi:hypothetical protein